jgi:hypothetical protein
MPPRKTEGGLILSDQGKLLRAYFYTNLVATLMKEKGPHV